MKARRFLGVVLLAVTAPCMAAPQQTPVQDELVPRTPLPKRTHLVAPQLSPLDRARGFDTRLVVKFRDDVKARPTGEGAVLSAAQTNVTEFNDRAAQAGLTFRSVFKRSFNRLALMEQRAALHSGRAQPDLGGIMYVEGDPAALHEYGAWLLENDLVEWVEFEQVARPMIEWEQGQKPFPAATTPPPATPPGVVLDEPPADDGAAFGGGGNCGPGNGACFRANGSPGCGKFSCCTTVCSTDPFCCSTDWDADCAGAASLTCDPARACCLFNEIFELDRKSVV